MLEATPGKPWGIGLKDLLDVEPDMKRRYFSSQLACSAFWEELLRTNCMVALIADVWPCVEDKQKENRERAYAPYRMSVYNDDLSTPGSTRGLYDTFISQ